MVVVVVVVVVVAVGGGGGLFEVVELVEAEAAAMVGVVLVVVGAAAVVRGRAAVLKAGPSSSSLSFSFSFVGRSLSASVGRTARTVEAGGDNVLGTGVMVSWACVAAAIIDAVVVGAGIPLLPPFPFPMTTFHC